MKRVLLLLALFCSQAFAGDFSSLDTKVLVLSSDKPIYATGETAVLRAKLLSKPNNSDYEFDIVAKLNGVNIPVSRITEFELFSSAKNLAPGNYTWQATLVLQDARYARDLKATISFYASEIERLTQAIAAATDPTVIANLQAEKAKDQSLKTSAENELASLRSVVLAPQSLTFSVQ